MKFKKIQLLGPCLMIGLVMVLAMVLPACSSSSPAATTTTSASVSSNTTTEINSTTATTTTKTSAKTTTTGKVTATLTSIAISPASPPNLKLGSTQTFVATGAYSDGSTVDISSLVTWNSSDPTKAEFININGGMLTGAGQGNNIVITATYQGITSNSVSINVVGSGLPQ
jgi:hypothetical protein